MSVSIYSLPCPYCHEMVWHTNGDESDITGHDTTHLTCHACEVTFLLPGLEDLFPDPDDESQWAVLMTGQSYPDQQSAAKGASHE